MEVIEKKDQLYILDDGRVREFLILGSEYAILIDTGFADSQVFETVKKITDLPVKVLLTHGDRDHAEGLEKFGECWAMEEDWSMIDSRIVLHPMREGDVFSCGAYQLEVIAIPGHTYGSAAFLDREKGLLISGDSVQKGGPIYMFGKSRNLNLYIESLRKLLLLTDQIREILPSHHVCPVYGDSIEKDLEDALALRAGKLTGTPHPSLPCQVFQGVWTSFYYVPDASAPAPQAP